MTPGRFGRARSADGMVFDEDLGDAEEVRVGGDDRQGRSSVPVLSAIEPTIVIQLVGA